MVPALLQVILLSFPAVCWIYGAGFIFSAFVSVIFWGHHAQVLPFLLPGTCCCMPHSWGPQSCPVLSWTVLTGHACCTEVFVSGQTRLGLPCALLKPLLCADALGDHPQEGCCGASCLHTGEPCSWTSQNGPPLSSCVVAGGVAFSHAWQHNTSQHNNWAGARGSLCASCIHSKHSCCAWAGPSRSTRLPHGGCIAAGGRVTAAEWTCELAVHRLPSHVLPFELSCSWAGLFIAARVHTHMLQLRLHPVLRPLVSCLHVPC